MIILVIILIILIIYFIIRYNRDRLYFRIKNNSIKENLPEINIDNHYIIYHKTSNNTKCLIISHGNSSNIYNSVKLIEKIKTVYKYDIYCYEYPGFGKCKGTLTINGCIREHLFWLNYLSERYNEIDLWGYSIGGGIVTQTIAQIPKNIEPKIKRIYFHNTFSNIKNVIRKHHILLYFLYKILLIDDLDTYNKLNHEFFKNKELIILHSKNDNIISFNEAIYNFNICKQLKYNIKLIELEGFHSKYEIKNID